MGPFEREVWWDTRLAAVFVEEMVASSLAVMSENFMAGQICIRWVRHWR